MIGRGYGHTEGDTVDKVHLRGLQMGAAFATRVALILANADPFPAHAAQKQTPTSACATPARVTSWSTTGGARHGCLTDRKCPRWGGPPTRTELHRGLPDRADPVHLNAIGAVQAERDERRVAQFDRPARAPTCDVLRGNGVTDRAGQFDAIGDQP